MPPDTNLNTAAEAAQQQATALKTVSSTSDQRVVNNVMRHEYKVLSDAEKEAMKTVKDMGLEFHNYIVALGSSRNLSLASTKIEEAVMWAVKHITG